ncbi:MAG TPA: ThuA domain-containing protein [Rhodothermales bacterium]|nr:ThuA domain-containing protein [Rhodothermales bacterium]
MKVARLAALLVVCAALLWPAAAHAAHRPEGGQAPYKILVYSQTNGFRHSSIPVAIEAVKKLGRENGFDVDATEDSTAFTDQNLAQYQAVVFLMTTGDVLNEAEQQAFRRYIENGGGYAGVHAAADTEYDWDWYGTLVGAYFKSHPKQQNATVLVLDKVFPATKMLPDRWKRFDELYNYRTNPRGQVHVLMALDEKTYEGGEMGYDHPIAWVHKVGKGRAFYTGLGHTEDSYSEPLFLQHLLGGIQWAAGQVAGDAGATITANYEKVVLDSTITDPMGLDVAKDGRVFWSERQGPIKVWDPKTQKTHLAGSLNSEILIEDGLEGIALDPNFLQNGWLYVYYAPADNGPNRLSRFTYQDGHIDLKSEKVLLEVPVQREFCCHTAGDVDFGPNNTLFLSTGENTHDTNDHGGGYDQRPGYEHGDAQRSTANTNDLRGKIIRIRPLPDGTYEIPEGNLFEADAKHRGEIYTMGHRNPWKISIDPKTGWLYWGDVGLGNAASEYGPNGWEEINQARGPGFFGWPYFSGPNDAFRPYDYVTGEYGDFFDPEHPINDSRNNTGARELPPAQPAFVWYFYGQSEEFPALGAGGMSASAGPVYRKPETATSIGLPDYYEGVFFGYDWMRKWIKEFHLDENGDLLKIVDFLPGIEFNRPTDIKVGPDGALYIAEWGDEFWGSNKNAKIVRLEYHGNDSPAQLAAAQQQPKASKPSSVSFTWPVNGGFVEYDQPFSYSVDAKNGGNVKVDVYTGHDTHQHLLEEKAGATGTANVDRGAYAHHPDLHYMDRFVALEAHSGNDVATVKLHPKRFDAEYTADRTAQRMLLGGHPAGTGYAETVIVALRGNDGDWAEYDPVNLVNINSLTFRVKPLAKSTLELHLDRQDGPLLAKVALDSVATPNEKPVEPVQAKEFNRIFDQALVDEAPSYAPKARTYEGWYEVSVPVQDPGGEHKLYMVFKGSGTDPLALVDWVQYNGAGVMASPAKASR